MLDEIDWEALQIAAAGLLVLGFLMYGGLL